MKKGKIVSIVVLLAVWVYPILFSGCQLLILAVAAGIDKSEKAADKKSKTFTDAREKDLIITKTDKGAVIKGYKGKNKNIRLPSEIKGMSVIGISDNAFAEKGLINVIIPDSVTTIGEMAFAGNNLSIIFIPNSVTTIGERAFAGNNLTSIIIPDSVTTIGMGAFYNNKISSITIPDSVTTIGDYAFANNELASVSVFSATRVGEGAFGRSRVTIRRTQAELDQIKAQNEAKELAEKQRQEERQQAGSQRSVKILFDLWNELNTNKTKDQALAKAKEVLKVTLPIKESTETYSLDVGNYYNNNVRNRFPKNLTTISLVSTLPPILEPIIDDYRNVDIFFYNGKLFAINFSGVTYTDGSFGTTSAQMRAEIEREYGEPTVFIDTRLQYPYYIWETPEIIIFCMGRVLQIINKQMLAE